MSGYRYGDPVPIETCPCCGDDAHAEFCDIGVGMQQIEPFHCDSCGSTQGYGPDFNPDGSRAHGWSLPSKPSDRGENVTGYYIRPAGHVIECTWKVGHKEIAERRNRSQSALRHEGWIRVTNLEGFGISLPPFVGAEAAIALSEVVEQVEACWGLPYVTTSDSDKGREMPLPELMRVVSRLPRCAPAEQREGADPLEGEPPPGDGAERAGDAVLSCRPRPIPRSSARPSGRCSAT